MTMGPVQVLVIGFEDPDFRGEVLAEIERLRQDDIVRMIDVVVVQKTADGELEKFSQKDFEASAEFGALAGALIGIGAGGEEAAEIAAVRGAEAAVSSDLLDDEEVWYIADAIPNGSAAAVALLEHRWAIGLRDAIGRAGGFHLADEWIHPRDLVAIGVAAAEETAESR
jgi:uncharacterized membrane protein